MDGLVIDRIVSYPMENNTYILYIEGKNGCVVIDPSGDGQEIIERIDGKELCVELILLTHGHFDHISSLNYLIARYHAPVAIHEDDAEMLLDCTLNMSVYGSDIIVASKSAERLLRDGDVVEAAGIPIKVIHTPGHTPGSCCFAVGNSLITGDTLFYMSVGRSDFPGGDTPQLIESVERLFELDGSYEVLPGHMRSSTIEYERENNVFMRNYSSRSARRRK